jgi:hypothetical protein
MGVEPTSAGIADAHTVLKTDPASSVDVGQRSPSSTGLAVNLAVTRRVFHRIECSIHRKIQTNIGYVDEDFGRRGIAIPGQTAPLEVYSSATDVP